MRACSAALACLLIGLIKAGIVKSVCGQVFSHIWQPCLPCIHVRHCSLVSDGASAFEMLCGDGLVPSCFGRLCLYLSSMQSRVHGCWYAANAAAVRRWPRGDELTMKLLPFCTVLHDHTNVLL